MAKFIVGIRNDLEETLREFGKEPELYEVFGPAPREISASGRIDCAPPQSLEEVKRQIDTAHNNQHHYVRFNVLANALCQHGNEFDPGFREKMLKLFDFVAEAGADSITIANSNIMRLARDYGIQYQAQCGKIPFEVVASTWRDITTVHQAESNVREFGIDIVHLHQYINRDFRTLRELREPTNKLHFDVVLYASTGSTWLCDDRQGHRCAISHPENTTGKMDSYKGHCIAERQRNPFLIYIAPTIPPEAISFYESLGYDRFKLAGRDMPTEWRIANLRRYLSRKTEPGVGIADLCDTNLGRKMPCIPVEEVMKLITELETLSHQPDFNFMNDYVRICQKHYGGLQNGLG